MATEIHQFSVTIPAGTPQSNLYVSDISLDYYDIESLDLEVPPGPSGLMGFYLALSGQQYIPYETGEFIVWDDRFDSWTLTDQPTGAGWQLVGYNNDVYDHTVVARFHVNKLPPLPAPSPSSIVIVSSNQSSGQVTLP
jgi:hypothetical protein